MSKQNTLFDGVKVYEPKTKNKVLNLVDKMNKPQKTIRKKGFSLEEVMDNVVAYTEKVRQRLPHTKFTLVKKDELPTLLDEILRVGVMSLDCEATGLNELTDTVVGISFSFDTGSCYYVPCAHVDYVDNVDITDFIHKVTKYSREGKIKVFMANAPFDIRMIKRNFNTETYIKCVWDVNLASHFLNENDKEHNLKFLWEKYVMEVPEKEITTDDYKSLFGNFSFGNLNPESVYIYGALDGLMTFQLYMFQRDYLEVGGVYNERAGLVEAGETFVIWNELNEAIAEMMDTGLRLDITSVEGTNESFQEQIQEIRKEFDMYVDSIAVEFLVPLKNNDPELFEKIDFPLNPASPSQLAILFFDAMGLKKVKGRSCDVAALEMLQKAHPDYYDLFDLVLQYRAITKLQSTYVGGLHEKINPKTGKIHAQFIPYGAVTGRFSSKEPNLQNIPNKTEIGRTIRKMFLPSEGYYLIGCDYSQQEPRILADLSKDKNMIDAYLQGKDIYANTASFIYNVPYEECTEAFGKEGKKRRDVVKAIVLGIMYGRGYGSIGRLLKLTSNEAKEVIERFYGSFPTVKDYIDFLKESCREYGYVKTAWGRKRRIPELNMPKYEFSGHIPTPDVMEEICKDLDSTWSYEARMAKINTLRKEFNIIVKDNGGLIAQADRQIVNSVVQGSASDMMVQAIVDIYKDPVFRELGGRLLVTVHDELIAEAPKETILQAAKRMEDLMVMAGAKKVKVPMKCDTEIMERWSGKNIKELLMSDGNPR